MSKTWIAAVLGVLIMASATPSFADRRRREERREERRDERRDRRQDRRDDRREQRQERRDDRRDRRRALRAPPSVRVERYTPRRGHVWVAGSWDWNGSDYVWIGGHYERERRGQRWRDRRWEQRDGEYVMVDGGWISIGPSSAPPVVRVERYENRSGFVWARGHWEWRGEAWAWVPGHYERERSGYSYREPRWEQRDGAWITVEGGWEVR